MFGPVSLSPPRVEDLVLIGGDGRIIDWTGANDREAKLVGMMGARLPGRGPVMDRYWRLSPAAMEWMRSIRGPDEEEVRSEK